MRITTRSAARLALILGVSQTLTTAVTGGHWVDRDAGAHCAGHRHAHATRRRGLHGERPRPLRHPGPRLPSGHRRLQLGPGGLHRAVPADAPGWGGLQGAKWNVSVQSGVESLTGEWTPA